MKPVISLAAALAVSAQLIIVACDDPVSNASGDLEAREAVVAGPPVGKLTFRRATPGTSASEAEIWMMNPDGSNPTRVTCNNRNEFASAWSPEGEDIVFYSQETVAGLPTQFLYLNTANGGCAPGTLLTEGRFARFSPDGSKLVFDRGRLAVRDIFVLDLVEGGEVNLTNDPVARNLRADWSPDGSKLVFARGGENAEDIYVMDADGSNVVQLTFDAAGDNAPKWSPDGTTILFQSDRDGDDEIYVMNTDGSGQTRLTFHPGRDASPDWSPNGKRIVWHADTPGSVLQLFMMDADGTNVVQITDLPTTSSFPDWGGGHVIRSDR